MEDVWGLWAKGWRSLAPQWDGSRTSIVHLGCKKEGPSSVIGHFRRTWGESMTFLPASPKAA